MTNTTGYVKGSFSYNHLVYLFDEETAVCESPNFLGTEAIFQSFTSGRPKCATCYAVLQQHNKAQRQVELYEEEQTKKAEAARLEEWKHSFGQSLSKYSIMYIDPPKPEMKASNGMGLAIGVLLGSVFWLALYLILQWVF